MRAIACEQGSPEWFAARTGVCTASRYKDAMATLKSGAPAKERLDYMAELAIERITGSLADKFVNDAMKRGTQLEPEARQQYSAETGELVQEFGFALHDTLALGCSPDGLVGDAGIIEIKCPVNAYKLAELMSGRGADEYMPQIQGNLWILGREWCDLVPYHPALPLRPIRVKRDEAYISKMADALSGFLADVDSYTAQLRQQFREAA